MYESVDRLAGVLWIMSGALFQEHQHAEEDG
jgi:hypothetical protein